MMELSQVKIMTGCLAYVAIGSISALIIWIVLGSKKCDGNEELSRKRIYETHNRICLFIAGILIAMSLLNLIPAVNQDMLKIITKNEALSIYLSQLGIITCFLLIWILSILIEFIIIGIRQRELADESTKILDRTTSLEAHYDVADHSNGMATALVLGFALTSHAFLEGLSVGLQETKSMVGIMSAISAIHECFLVVAIVLKFRDAGIIKYRSLAMIGLAFSLVSPVGMLIGAAITGANLNIYLVVAFRCLATGGILYVVFLEMIPHCVFSADHARWLSAMLITSGAIIMAAIALVHVFQHTHTGTNTHSNASKVHIDHLAP